MVEEIEALIRLGEALANGSVGLLVLSLGVNAYLFAEYRRVTREHISDLKEARERSDRNRTLTKEVIDVMAALP